jgi:putative oxidoreductase
MAAFGMPPSLLPFAVTAELSGGVLDCSRLVHAPAALMLAGFCAVRRTVFHTRFSDHNQLLHFEKDLALAGAFLILSMSWGLPICVRLDRASTRTEKLELYNRVSGKDWTRP